MFFNLSKILWPLLAPLNLLLMLYVTATALVLTNRRKGALVLTVVSTLFIAIGVFPLGYNLLVMLENRYNTPEILPGKVDGIIVLGGFFDTGLSKARGQPLITDSAERMLDALYLARRYPEAQVVFSGGEGVLRPAGKAETTVIKEFFDRQGFTPENAVYESRSRNTYENALYTKQLLSPQPEQQWIIVTSAYHMPRAMAVFESLGWQNLTPWATDYRTDGEIYLLPRQFSVIGNFYFLELAARELLGYVIYRFTGKISLP